MHLDKGRLLEALRGSIQSPRAGELLILRVEQGEFDVEEPASKKKAEPKKDAAE